MFLLLLLVTIAIFFFWNRQDNQPEGLKASIPTQKSKLQQVKTPIWSDEDFEESYRKLEHAVRGEVFMKDPDIKPPFYESSKPLTYRTYNDPSWYHEYHFLVALCHDFGEFKNVFLYGRSFPIAGGARTFDKTGRLVAEARLLRLIEGDQGFEGIEIEEFHYGPDGKLIFKCKSQFDRHYWKIGQTEVIGKKLRDYYFIWAKGH